jgi:2-polyprenyl-3-methyl-5-hydroxy-6-metoxy-1,4-benzoquinol methylase
LFLHPPIPQVRLLACYAQASGERWGTADSFHAARLYAGKKELLDRFSPGKRVLDFGCFDGGFLGYLGAGYEKFGVEPAVEPARLAEKRGVTIVGKTIDDVPADLKVDAIVAMDVFEHLNDPIAVLRRFARLLNRDGMVLIETGNSDEPLWRRVGTRYPYMAPVEHVGMWNESSMREAGRRSGLPLVHFQTSAHHALRLRERLAYPLYNAAYHLLRALDAMKLPLPAPLRATARGPLPRTTREDHFLAVLKIDGSGDQKLP